MTVDLSTEWRNMQHRILKQLENKHLPDMADDALEVRASLYTDIERFDRECSLVFRRQPLLAALSHELAKPGDRIHFDAAGVQVLIMRGGDGKLRAFLNICTHRGATLVDDESQSLVCPYHGWAYNDDGSVKNLPLSEGFSGVDLSSKGLVKLPVTEWQGMVFVVATPGEETIDVEAYLGELGPLLAALNLQDLHKNAQDQLNVETNWKLALDTGREIYHVPMIHRNTLAKNLYPHIMIYDQYGLHNRYCGAGKDFAKLIDTPEEQWPTMRYQAVHYIYPNTTLAISHSVDGESPMVSLSRVFPDGAVGKTKTYLSTYSRTNDPASIELHNAVVGVVSSQDYVQATQVWKNLEHQPEFKLVWGKNEALLQQYHQQLAEQIDRPLSVSGGFSHSGNVS